MSKVVSELDLRSKGFRFESCFFFERKNVHFDVSISRVSVETSKSTFKINLVLF